MTPQKILRLPDVIAIVGLKRSAIYKAIAEKRFPQPVQLAPGCRAVGWLETEIASHQKRCAAARNRKPNKRKRRA
jgi:prophage regulatory protein